MINSTDTDNSGLIVTEIDLLQTERFVVLEINRGLSPVFSLFFQKKLPLKDSMPEADGVTTVLINYRRIYGIKINRV